MMLNNGIFGMLMGWFNQHCLNNLQDQLHEKQRQQNRLLLIQMVQLHRIKEFESVLREAIETMELAQTAWLNYGALHYTQEQLRYNLLKLI
jgi:hypothetical protein